MYVVFLHGGKQYQAHQGQIIKLDKINFKTGDQLHINNILMIVNNENITIGKPNIKNSSIISQIIRHGRQKKVKIIKFRRRKHYKKQQGHRQHFTEVKIIDIITT
ncbi:50S ribosomal protein L21 [Buchnera aphidicola (Takecallis arundicolens)]|uniref:50S ribosomal protein L21 n=1 Tax=Buchnera aphidicola TaxID=9 RepID=UPI003464A1A1